MRQALVLFILAAAALAGCSTGSSPNGGAGDAYMVSAKTTAFFRFGPAQTLGADLSLTQGQRMTMLQRGGGYSRVKLETGDAGYVATEDIQAAPEPSPTPAQESSRRSRSREDYSTSLPQPETPLPSSDEPAPKFRY